AECGMPLVRRRLPDPPDCGVTVSSHRARAHLSGTPRVRM
ncbi:MAG: hypothetical protein AVDCRST_MAG88-1658, partial [uncultured Thermomicrobiales bacterium]